MQERSHDDQNHSDIETFSASKSGAVKNANLDKARIAKQTAERRS